MSTNPSSLYSLKLPAKQLHPVTTLNCHRFYLKSRKLFSIIFYKNLYSPCMQKLLHGTFVFNFIITIFDFCRFAKRPIVRNQFLTHRHAFCMLRTHRTRLQFNTQMKCQSYCVVSPLSFCKIFFSLNVLFAVFVSIQL